MARPKKTRTTTTRAAPACARPKPAPSKTDRLRRMLATGTGASLAEICTETGWQAHSARAAISGLRKAGWTVERSPAAEGAPSRYRITGERGTA